MEKKMRSGLMLMLMFTVLGLKMKSLYADICSDALIKLLPCQPFLLGASDDIIAPCCEGAQSVNQLASSKENLKALCECLTQSVTMPGIDIERAKQIPQHCNIVTPLPPDPHMDCNKL